MSLHLIKFWQGRTEDAYRDVVRLEMENAKLKEELKTTNDSHRLNTSMWKNASDQMRKDCESLQAEVDRLQGLFFIRQGRLAVPYDYDKLKNENALLHADIELWRKAGELMLDHINSGMTAEYRVIEAINAAKGGQS